MKSTACRTDSAERADDTTVYGQPPLKDNTVALGSPNRNPAPTQPYTRRREDGRFGAHPNHAKTCKRTGNKLNRSQTRREPATIMKSCLNSALLLGHTPARTARQSHHNNTLPRAAEGVPPGGGFEPEPEPMPDDWEPEPEPQ